MNEIRQPAVAGMFYPANPQTLSSDIDRMLSDAEKQSIKGTITALIVPHAGYAYSGKTAALAYKTIEEKKYDTVVIISPSHREYFRGISIFNGQIYRSPLGDISINTHLRDMITSGDKLIESSAHGHGTEHAIEIQLPFLQKVIKDFTILPIVIGDQNSDYCFHLGNRLGDVLKNKNVLIVASTDLSHFHPYTTAKKLDQIVINYVTKFDYKKLMEALEFEQAEACGGGPMVSAMLAAEKLGADSSVILHQCNSGDVTGEHDSVVGYFSAVLMKSN